MKKIKIFLKRVFNDLKNASPNLKDKAVLKRALVISVIVILFLFAFRNVKSEITVTSAYDFQMDSTAVVLVDHNLKKTMKISEDVWKMDSRLERVTDFLCEINGIKYYLINNKIKL